ncbi:MAG: putative metal-binding motif-containing protein, partial [Myxococcota bacterium]
MSFNRNMSLVGVLSTLLISLLSSGCLSDADVWQRLNDADQDGVKACGPDSNPLYCDCDDRDPNIYPAHDNVMAPPELCDGKDNDCNLTADDGLIFYTYYPDADADGVGSLDSNLDGSPDAKQSCQSTLEGYTRSSDDCNDANTQIYPGSPFETCDRLDNIDYNCDGSTGKQDADGDRSPACEDCNDANAEQWPGHLEVCDGVDNDCNGGVDDLTEKQLLYRDADTDGYGNAKVSKQFDRCEESGYVSNALDCDDTNALINPTAEERCDLQDNNCNGQTDEGLENKQLYADEDHDGYGNPNKPAQACTAPDGYVENDDDCNDRDPNSYPGAAESCTATVDSNCDGSVGDVDQDKDGIPACLDCNDADATVYPAYNGKPGATEKCDDIDQNCNGVNDDLSEEITLFEDKDRDGFGNPLVQLRSKSCNVNGYVSNANDCDDSRATVNPEADEVCDALDSDCDGKVPSTEADADGDGVRTCSENNQPPDCNDGDNTVYPSASEGCDGIDNNCNAQVDEGVQRSFYPDADQDGYGDGSVSPVDACEAPIGTVSNGSDCQDDDALIHPDASERCDGVDNNCDGVIDEDLLLLTWPDADADGFGDSRAEPEALCIRPEGIAGNDDDCDDSRADINPLAGEVLNNGLDDNCNGEVDEAFSWLYPDLDGDGYGAGEAEYVETQSVGYSPLFNDCDDAHASMYPGAEEQCDTLDNDCDEQVDEGVKSTFYQDADADGFGLTSAAVSGCSAPPGTSPSAGDCDDADEDTYPGADERCDLADNDCDGVVDEKALDALPFYPDADQDGYGASGSVPLYACAAPVGQVDNDDDCNDRDDDVNPDGIEVCDGKDTDCDGNPDNGVSNAQTWHPDADKDGYGDLNRALQSCSAPTVDNLSWILDGRDCNDANPNIKPGASETCNGIDDDCNGIVDDGQSNTRFFRDADGDGFGDANHSQKACVAPPGYVSVQGDCNDTNPNIYPGAVEVCDNQDNDCDTQVDEGLLQTFYKDQDGDGYGDPQQSQLACPTPTGYVSRGGDCNDGNAQVYPSAPEQCNGLDDNCNGQLDEGVSSTWYQDADQDGHGNPASTQSACARPDGYLASPADDCNDTNPNVYPGAVEVCDTVDNNCNGTTDEGVTTTYYRDGDRDGYGSASSTLQGCKVPSGYVSNKLDCNDADANINPDAIEVCDGKDQDCNAQIDEGLPVFTYYRDADGDGYGNSSQSQSACKTPDGYVSVGGDCNDADKAIAPNASEVCNGKDDDCDGATDEGLPTQTWYKDGDLDGYGLSTSSQVACAQPTGYSAQSGDCVDTDKNTFPGAAEKESTTACMTDADGDGYGAKVPASGVAVGTDCVDTDKLINPTATESCNGKDDDCDGLVDAAD